MADLTNTDRMNTLSDDIRYQIVKEDSRRSSFSSNDKHILLRGRQLLQDIEKREKLVETEFRRQHAILTSKLEKLQQTREMLTVARTSDRVWKQRRNSEPGQSSRNSKNDRILGETSRNLSVKSRLGNTVNLPLSRRNSYQNVVNNSTPNVLRDSSENQPETIENSLEELNGTCLGNHRRASLSDSASLTDYFPSADDLLRLSQIRTSVSNIDEDATN